MSIWSAKAGTRPDRRRWAQPVLVVAVSWTVFHEPASSLQAVGGILTLAGAWLIGRDPAEAA